MISLEQNEQFLKNAYGKARVPCMLSILSGNINILVDGILVGQRLGTDALAAINFSLPVYFVFCIAGSKGVPEDFRHEYDSDLYMKRHGRITGNALQRRKIWKECPYEKKDNRDYRKTYARGNHLWDSAGGDHQRDRLSGIYFSPAAAVQ